MRLTKQFWTASILATLLSLNCFANYQVLNARQAKKATEESREEFLFTEIETAAQTGYCSVDLDIKALPKNYKELLAKYGYQSKYWDYAKQEHVSWCD